MSLTDRVMAAVAVGGVMSPKDPAAVLLAEDPSINERSIGGVLNKLKKQRVSRVARGKWVSLE